LPLCSHYKPGFKRIAALSDSLTDSLTAEALGTVVDTGQTELAGIKPAGGCRRE
jgi:hypothetical protein